MPAKDFLVQEYVWSGRFSEIPTRLVIPRDQYIDIEYVA